MPVELGMATTGSAAAKTTGISGKKLARCFETKSTATSPNTKIRSRCRALYFDCNKLRTSST
jgi:hypothetical protein